MKKPFILVVSALLTSCLCACNLPGTVPQSGANPGEVATAVVLTLASFTQTAQPLPLSTPTLEQLSSPTLAQPTITPTIAMTATLTSTPGPSPTQTPTLPPTNTPIPKPGSIAGAISGYPYGSQPALAIVAFGQQPPYYYSYVIINPGASSYS